MRFAQLVLVLVPAFVVACSSETEGTAPSPSTDVAQTTSFCAGFCERKSACDSTIDEQTCLTSCDDSIRTDMRRLRNDIVEPARACFVASDCRQVLSGERLGECLAEAAVSVAPSVGSRAFCDGFLGAIDRCGGDRVLDRASCLRATARFSDETLAAARACTDKSCTALGPCVEAELGL